MHNNKFCTIAKVYKKDCTEVVVYIYKKNIQCKKICIKRKKGAKEKKKQGVEKKLKRKKSLLTVKLVSITLFKVIQ